MYILSAEHGLLPEKVISPYNRLLDEDRVNPLLKNRVYYKGSFNLDLKQVQENFRRLFEFSKWVK